MQLSFVDASRRTPESAGGPEVPERAIDVWLTLPSASEPRPLVVFSHGMAGHPRKFEALHTADTNWEFLNQPQADGLIGRGRYVPGLR
jgi:predicted dienelactone hydrolase